MIKFAALALLVSCGAMPDEMSVGAGRGFTGFSGAPDAWDDLGMDTDSVHIEFTWYLHTPTSHEIRGLRNDMRRRAHEESVEREAEEDREALVAEVAAATAEPEPAPPPPSPTPWGWLFENLEVAVWVLGAILSAAFAAGKWMARKKPEEKSG